MTATLPLTLSEASFQRTVIDYALLRGWRVAHHRPARTVHGWRTPVEGHPGVPDLILARDGRVLLVELKRQHGRPTPDQRLWLEALHGHGRIWRPGDWEEIMAELA